jgi:ribose 1,5-bisphosphate isomerase
MNPEIADKIDAIRLDRIHGASWLSREALAVLKLAAETSQATSSDDFSTEMRDVAQKLMAARPAMAPITNAVSRFVSELRARSKQDKDLDSLTGFARSRCDELIKQSEQAALEVAQIAARMIADGERLMTCSYSSTVCQALGVAEAEGKHFEVLAAESKFGGKAYGELTAAELQRYGIPVELIPDGDIKRNMARVSKVLVGADSILADGTLINGSPTYELASAAKDGDIPFYAVCETAKFNVRGQIESEPGFDRIPPHLVTGIITERGLMKPEEVSGHITEMAQI